MPRSVSIVRRQQDQNARTRAIREAADQAIYAQQLGDQRAYEAAERDAEAARQAAVDYALAQEAAANDANVGNDGSPFPIGDYPLKPKNYAGRSFYSPYNKGASLVFKEEGGMLFVTEMKNGKVVKPYEKLNCGRMDRIAGLTRGVSCTVNPYRLEGTRTGSTSIDFAIYPDANGRATVSPLFDYELEAWQNDGADLMFHDWAQK